MNAYIILIILLALVLTVLGYFALTNTLAMIAIMFSGSGAIVVMCFVAAWQIKLSKMMYPIRVRTYGERYDSFQVTNDTRGRVTKDKKGYEWLELINGKRLKMPNRKYLMKGDDLHVDLFDTKEQQFPITFVFKEGDEKVSKRINNEKELFDFVRERPVVLERENIGEVYKKIIPEEQRVFFADKVIPSIKEATKPPVNQWAQLIPIISVVTLCCILIVGMLFVPEYWTKSEQYGAKFMSALAEKEEALKEFVATSPIVCNCPGYGKGEVEPPEPPPG